MNMTYERYTDNYGARVALKKVPFNLKDEMKAALPFPQMVWNGGMGLWAIQDRADVIENALAFLADHDITVDGLESMRVLLRFLLTLLSHTLLPTISS